MNQFKRVQVIMLPTEQKVENTKTYQIVFSTSLFWTVKIEEDRYTKGSNWIFLNNCKNGMAITIPNKDYKQHHLYIISNDEIKEGDWCYCTDGYDGFTLRQVMIGDTANYKRLSNGYTECNIDFAKQFGKKVIATTDTLLRVYEPCIQCDGTGETTFSGTYTTQKECDLCNQLKYPNTKSLPKLSQQFIEKYIEEYNKGNVIKDILIEEIFPGGTGSSWKLKVNPKDNTITIKKSKDSWDKKELKEILQALSPNISFEKLPEFNKNSSDAEKVEWGMEKADGITTSAINKWIKENL